MTQKEFKQSIKALKSCIYIIENEAYDAFKTNYFVSDVYKKSDDVRINNIRDNIDDMLFLLKDIYVNMDSKVLRHVR